VLPESALVLEWAGRIGHPTSYALLAAPAPVGLIIEIPTEKRVFAESLAGRGDEVLLGDLGHEELLAVEGVLETGGGWHLMVVASGQVGSSPNAFQRVATFLNYFNREVGPVEELSETTIWNLWDQTRP